jgi:aubergine-like protein
MYLRGCARSRGRLSRSTASRDQDLVSGEGSSIVTGVTSPTPSTISGMTTQLDSLSLATDDTDRYPTTSKFPKTRPSELSSKQGESGQEIALVANYIKILAAPKWDLYRYHCSFEPNIELRKIRRETLAKAGIKDVAFDGTLLYSFEDFGQEKTVSSQHPVTNETVTIKLKRTATASPESPEFFHLANLIVRKLLEIAGLKLLGRNYYSFDKKIDLDRFKLTLFPGFMTAVNVYEGQLMINVDLSTKVMNKQTVYSILTDKFNRINDPKQAQDASLKELVGQIVLTPYNNETYKIMDIVWDKDPTYQFTKRDGTTQTLAQYYQEKYHIQIKDEKQPLISVKASKRMAKRGPKKEDPGMIFLIPELCSITGISDAMRQDFSLMKEMSVYTHVGPSERFQQLNGFLKDIQEREEGRKELSKWHISLDQKLVELTGRTMEAESIIYKDRTIKYNPLEADWSREGRSLAHLSAKNLDKWIVIFTQRDSQTAHSFVDALYKVCTPFGMRVDFPDMVELPNDRPETFIRAIQDKANPQLDLICCILTNNRKDRYDAIKKVLCVDCPVPSQMLLSKTLQKQGQLMSVATKVGIQINAKLGGEIWSVQIPSKTIMVVGIDTYRDSQSRSSQMVGFVASINPTCTRYYSRVIEQRSDNDLISGLKSCMQDALQKYHQVNGILPAKIIIYRDGVNDFQLLDVIENELPALNELCMKAQEGYDPKLGMIIVKKRGSARFFARDPRGGRQLMNPPPGTIIDHTVTNQEWYDFYLISQMARQGTVAPTHFNVIWDRTGLKVDHMQRLTQKLCHLYYNWPGTIRVPGVCQYAHKLAFLAAQSLHSQPHESLADKLFYL